MVKIDVLRMTVRALCERVLKKELNMVAPDVEIDDGQGTILISSEEGETDDIADRLLKVTAKQLELSTRKFKTIKNIKFILNLTSF